MSNNNELPESDDKSQESKYKIGKISIPKVGADNGVYITELQTDKSQKQKAFASSRVLRESGNISNDLNDGQLVKYKVNQEDNTLIEELEPL